MLNYFRKLFRVINPAHHHIDGVYSVGSTLFVFGWRNPTAPADGPIKLRLYGVNPVFKLRLDYSRPDVCQLFGVNVNENWGACWVFSVEERKMESKSIRCLLRKYSVIGKEYSLIKKNTLLDGFFNYLSEEQRHWCTRASQGEFDGDLVDKSSSRNVDIISSNLTEVDRDLSACLSGFAYRNSLLYLKFHIPESMQIFNVSILEEETLTQVFSAWQLVKNFKIYYVCFEGLLSKQECCLKLQLSEGKYIVWSLPIAVQSRLPSVLKVLLQDLDFRDDRTVPWIEETEFLKLVLRNKPNLKNKSNIKVMQGGTSNFEDVQCSILIPVYGRIDLIKYQINAFLAFPSDINYEVVFVLDDPTLEREFFELFEDLLSYVNLNLKAVFSGENLGFGGANNFGVQYCVGSLLLLLNSDVFPLESGWLNYFVDAYRTTNKIGILSSVLLYENELVQHAGMTNCEVDEFPGLLLNIHPGKNENFNVLLLDELSESELVTGAFMLMDKKLYNEVDGFSNEYLIGDFEDSDLCKKVLRLDKKNYLLSGKKMIHMERKSQSIGMEAVWKQNLTLLNSLIYTKKWKNIKEING